MPLGVAFFRWLTVAGENPSHAADTYLRFRAADKGSSFECDRVKVRSYPLKAPKLRAI